MRKKMRIQAYYIVAITFASLVQAEKNEPFFPASDRSGDTTISHFENAWYSEHLETMEEESLYSKREEEKLEIYRFTLLPTWGDPRSVTIELEKEANLATIQYSRLDGDGGYDPGKLVEKETRDLSGREFKDFIKLFEEIGFSNQTTNDPILGLDGSQWILERLKNGEYHIVVRWTADAYDPEKRGTRAFVDLCNWMLDNAPRAKNQKSGSQGL